MEAAIPCNTEDMEMGSIDSWRRGIAEAEVKSVGTSVDGEFITPEAQRQKKERIRERAREERIAEEGSVRGSVKSGRSERTLRRVGSGSTLRQRDIPARSSSRVAPSETGRSMKSKHREKVKESKEKKPKKSSAISVLFKKKEKTGKRESDLSHRPKVLEV